RQTMRALGRLRYLLAGSSTSARPAASGLVELMRHLQVSLAALPDRLEVRPAPDLLRKIRLTHARRALRRRAVLLAVAAGVLLIVAVLAVQLAVAAGPV
ncbi:MAG: hypothetical protein QOG49_1639, partial [Frankiaceae bacterium]|nr:hypothetical protein [Frankiaceae bacterium]